MQRSETSPIGSPFQEEIKAGPLPPVNMTAVHGLKSLKEMPNLAALPEVPPAFDFWGVLPVSVDSGHLVALVILAKVALGLDEYASRDLLQTLWAATQVLKTHLLSSNDKAERFAAMLSRSMVSPTSTDGGVEVVTGPHGGPTGFYLRDTYLQVVLSCVILTNDHFGTDSSDLYPFIRNDCADTYLLPASTDFVEFGNYLAKKHENMLRGTHPQFISKEGFNNPSLFSQILILGGTCVVFYSIYAYLFLLPFFDSVPLLNFTPPILLGCVILFATVVQRRNLRVEQIAAGNYIRGMSMQAIAPYPDIVQEISAQLSPQHAAQFICEMNLSDDSNLTHAEA